MRLYVDMKCLHTLNFDSQKPEAHNPTLQPRKPAKTEARGTRPTSESRNVTPQNSTIMSPALHGHSTNRTGRAAVAKGERPEEMPRYIRSHCRS